MGQFSSLDFNTVSFMPYAICNRHIIKHAEFRQRSFADQLKECRKQKMAKKNR